MFACADLLRWQRLICSPVLVALSKYAVPPSASALAVEVLEEPAQRRKTFEEATQCGLAAGLVDHDDVAAVHLRVHAPSAAHVADVERRRHALPLHLPDQHDATQVRERVQPFREGDGLQQRRSAHDRVDAGLAHRTLERDPLAHRFLDEHRHLRVLQVAGRQFRREFGLELMDAPATGTDHAHQRQRHLAIGSNPDRARQVRHAEHADFQQILRPDAVIARAAVDIRRSGGIGRGKRLSHQCARGARRSARRHEARESKGRQQAEPETIHGLPLERDRRL